jgi:hypothetical protein
VEQYNVHCIHGGVGKLWKRKIASKIDAWNCGNGKLRQRLTHEIVETENSVKDWRKNYQTFGAWRELSPRSLNNQPIAKKQ